MPQIAMVFGVLLIVLGTVGYVGTDAKNVTALIPAFLGGVLLVLGFVGRTEHLRKHMMHAAVAVGMFGFLGGLGDLVRRIIMGKLEWGAPAYSLLTMIVLCGVFVALCVKSFIDARRARRAQENAGPSAS